MRLESPTGMGVTMSDTATWIGQARDHVTTVQTVLDEVERGLAAVEKVEEVTDRAVSAFRVFAFIALGCLTGLVAALVVSRWRRSRLVRSGEPSPTEAFDGGPPGPVQIT
jgi:hypothetical protein